MRLPAIVVAALLCLTAVGAQARAYDAKALARYDVSYTKCEARFPQMQGHRDEAYLNLWRIKPDDKSRDRLAKLRGEPAYRAERQRVLQTSAKSASAPASSPLERECQGLWAENQRVNSEKR
jgi:hypothetical protein